VRNFEIVASSSQEAGKFRLTAIVIYVAPALAVNGAALAWIATSHRVGSAALLVAATYVAFVLFGLALLSIASWTELQRVLGGLMPGFGCSLAGSLGLLAAGVMLLREPAATPGA
jgi:apolipoprotein N-acyltransferase